MELIMKSQFQDNQPPNFGLAIFDYGDESLFFKTLDSLKNIDYDKKHFKIVISTKHNSRTRLFFDAINDLVALGFNCELIISLDERVDAEKEAYSKCLGARFLCKLLAGEQVEVNVFSEINDIITTDKCDGVAFESGSMKIVDFNVANNFYLEYGSFDLLFEAVKKESTELGKFYLV